jgi:uncharacterized Zn-finger protein
MENRKEFNFSSQMDNAKKSVVTIIEDRLAVMTKSLDNLNNTSNHVLKLNEAKITNALNKNIPKEPRVNRLISKFKSHKKPLNLQLISKSAYKALSFKMVLARRKSSKYESLKQRINKTLYYFEGFKRFKCQKCAKIFKFESNFKRHSCVDSIKTKSSSDFKKHSRNHLQKKPYKCDVCGKEYIWPSYLKIHKRSHSNEKPYACDLCNKKCTTLGNLNIHKWTHTRVKKTKNHLPKMPFSCDECGKEFFSKSHLVIHKRTHTKEKPFSCDLCEKKFSTLGILKVHKRKHTGERPYSCDKCGKRFTQLSSLRNHSKLHKNQQKIFFPQHFK